MSDKIISSSKVNTKILSLKEKGFRNDAFSLEHHKLVNYDGENNEYDNSTIYPNSENTKGFLIDSFCEKPSYVPMVDKRDNPELYNKAKKYSLYFPLSDKLDGYNLYDSVYSDYLPAKGVFSEGDTHNYYDYINGRYRLKTNIQEGTSLSNLYVKLNSLSLDRLSNSSSNLYKNFAFLTESCYGQKINYFYDGIAPGTSESCNILYGVEPTINTTVEISKSVFKTKSYVLTLDAESDKSFEFNISTETSQQGFTFSFFGKVDDFEGTDLYQEDVNNRKVASTSAIIAINGNLHKKVVTLNTDWKQYSFYVPIENVNSIGVYFNYLTSGTLKVKLCGFMLNKGKCVVNFDDRYHIKHEDEEQEDRIIKYPALISFLDNNDLIQTKMDKFSSWTISYKRLLNIGRNKDDNLLSVNIEKVDQIGKGLYLDSSDSAGYLENVFVIYDSENSPNEIKYIIFYENSKIEKIISLPEGKNYEYFVDYIPEDNRIHFNIILGGYVENDTIQINNFCRYSDFMAFPYVLSDEEINKIGNSLMSVSFGSKSYDEFYKKDEDSETETLEYELRENLNVLRSSHFFETKNI